MTTDTRMDERLDETGFLLKEAEEAALCWLNCERHSKGLGPVSSLPDCDDSNGKKNVALRMLRATSMLALRRTQAEGAVREGVGEVLNAVKLRLREHWLTGIHCDHERKTDRASCSCSIWRGEEKPSIDAAVQDWVEHAMPTFATSLPQHAQSGAVDRYELADAFAQAFKSAHTSWDGNRPGKRICPDDAMAESLGRIAASMAISRLRSTPSIPALWRRANCGRHFGALAVRRNRSTMTASFQFQRSSPPCPASPPSHPCRRLPLFLAKSPSRGGEVMAVEETKAKNPYVAVYRAKETSILGGARTDLRPVNDTLADRLQQYAFYRQENAKEGHEAMLVMDLLDAVTALRRARPTTHKGER